MSAASALPPRLAPARNVAPPPVPAWRNLVAAARAGHGASRSAECACGGGSEVRSGTAPLQEVYTCGNDRMAADPHLLERRRRRAEEVGARRAAAAAASGGRYGLPYLPSSEERPEGPSTGSDREDGYGSEVPVTVLGNLAFAGRLHLGTMAGAPLYVEVPEGDVATTRKDEMLAVYLGGWVEALHPDSAAWASKVIDRRTRAQLPNDTVTGVFDWLEDALSWAVGAVEDLLFPGAVDLSDPIPGLFWQEDYLNGALVMAVQTAHAFAPVLKLMAPEAADASAYRDGALVRQLISGEPDPETGQVRQLKIADAPTAFPRVGGITVETTGKVLLSTNFGTVAYNLFGTVLIEPLVRDRAALADYLFWWAHRCYSLGIETGDPTYKVVGQAAAKCALAEIVWIASIIVHEIGHDYGTPYAVYHCDADMCCNQYVAEFAFSHLTRGALGLPPAAPNNEYRALENAGDEFMVNPPPCKGTSLRATHSTDSVTQPLWRIPHQVVLETTIDPGCGGSGNTHATVVSDDYLLAIL